MAKRTLHNMIKPRNGGNAVRTTKQLSITLPNDMADLVEAKVASGEYATASEVIRDGLRLLMERDQAIETWLREEVATAYDELKADPSKALTVDQVREALAEAHRRRSAAEK